MTKNNTYYDKGLGGGRNTLDARRFWEAAQEERLIVQRCDECDEYVFPPQDVCAYCWADALDWVEVDGEGRIHSFSTIHVDIHSTWGDRVPYTVAFVELDEGPFLVTNVVDCEPDDIEIGTAVEVTFGELPAEDGLFPQFRLRE
ncbi:Zn-ribbon domain-containing OB-fold protein [Natronosalvus halobius]|uniref:Zn-ribbon domain-containing OB-fold protein n=1 Tax=Natronosalvus halobius TaxID=2953746 RepID=UPI0020A011AA|nr:Zn-ribbon domain-containing OB-fold protein [Natronosalvus halobius]USZ73600.1 Zn-ribbon domain-containing OB-fold protein [Natronosalvus halobius]